MSVERSAEGQRVYTIYVCDGCGFYGAASDLDRWSQCLVKHGRGDTRCLRPARRIELSERTPLAPEGEVVWAALTETYTGPLCRTYAEAVEDGRRNANGSFQVRPYLALTDTQAQEITEGRRDG